MLRISVLLIAVIGCGTKPAPPVVDAGPPRINVTITATDVVTRSETREQFLASAEMQISGEPLAEAMGRDLGAYSRDFPTPDLYFERSRFSPGAWIDIAGFSSGIESYEYSKQAMNTVAFESGAGTSLVYGPLVNTDGGVGLEATAALAARVQQFAAGSNALGRFVFPANTYPIGNPTGNVNPTGLGTPDLNPLGWPGIWPTVHVFRSVDPAIIPSSKASLWCAVSSDDSPGASGAAGCADYECDASSLHLTNRSAQVDRTITPGADGFNAWKYGLWVLNYLQVMHDSTEAGVRSVDGAALARVGVPGNKVVGADDTGAATAEGTFLGSSDVEGFQAAMFLEELDNRFEDWISVLTTADGATLSGFANVNDALAYSVQSPLRWFPKEISVTETDDGSGFPHPHYALGSPDSQLLDLLGVVLSSSTLHALTDPKNTDVGGAQTALVYFDGNPFPASGLRDRSLAMLRVAVVNLDRLHVEKGLFVDDVKLTGTTPNRGATVSTTSVAYAVIALRTALRSLSSQLQLYSNNTPDRAVATTPLDFKPIHLPGQDNVTFGQRLSQLLKAHAVLLLEHLTDDTGRAYPSWNVKTDAVGDSSDLLDAHTAAVRGLFASYLATGDVRYRDRAVLVFKRLDRVFYDPIARVYSDVPAPVSTVTFTPLRFALLQSALRDTYELIAARPGEERLAIELEDRIGRLNKLVLNGWDDRNGNRVVDWPRECIYVVDALPRGGLQMAERTLTGEIGAVLELPVPIPRTPTSDREGDCVPEIDDARLPASLASSITLNISRSP